jgi:hypothetical protein
VLQQHIAHAAVIAGHIRVVGMWHIARGDGWGGMEGKAGSRAGVYGVASRVLALLVDCT